jgi:hypothetical protein
MRLIQTLSDSANGENKMALNLIETSLDSVPENLRDLYEKSGDNFRLKVDGVDDAAGLKSALASERKLRAEAEKLAKSVKDLGKSPQEIAEVLARVEAEEQERAKKSGDFESIMKQKADAFQAEKASLLEQIKASQASEREAVIGNNLMLALNKAGVTSEGAELLPDRLANRIKYEMQDGKRLIKIVQADGVTPMAGSAPDGSATFDDLIKEAVAKFPSQFKRPDSSGGGKLPANSAINSGSIGNFGGSQSERVAAIKNKFPQLQKG